MTGGLLVIGAHPDDEVLIAGGTLAACAAAGLGTGVVSLTHGELGPIADPALATRETLGEVRLSELRAASAELGVTFVRCYHWRDGELRWADRSGIVRQLAEVLDERRPEGVVTFGQDGLYHHPDHVTTYELTIDAVERLPHPPALYRSVWPKSLIRELKRELQGRGLPADLWEIDLERFGTEDIAGSFAVDVHPVVDRKLRALRAHRTQFSTENPLAALEDGLAKRFLSVERFAQLNESPNWLKETLGDV